MKAMCGTLYGDVDMFAMSIAKALSSGVNEINILSKPYQPR